MSDDPYRFCVFCGADCKPNGIDEDTDAEHADDCPSVTGDDMPETGKVIVAHPSCESVAQAISDRDGLPYYLHSYVPADSTRAYVLDMDAIDFIPVIPVIPR